LPVEADVPESLAPSAESLPDLDDFQVDDLVAPTAAERAAPRAPEPRPAPVTRPPEAASPPTGQVAEEPEEEFGAGLFAEQRPAESERHSGDDREHRPPAVFRKTDAPGSGGDEDDASFGDGLFEEPAGVESEKEIADDDEEAGPEPRLERFDDEPELETWSELPREEVALEPTVEPSAGTAPLTTEEAAEERTRRGRRRRRRGKKRPPAEAVEAAKTAPVEADQIEPKLEFEAEPADELEPAAPPATPPKPSRNGGRQRFPSRRPRQRPLIQNVLRKGQEVLVQVIKEGIGNKGPTLSTYLSIPGRYLVLMPGLVRVGVSRKIIDEEQRRRLRQIVMELQRPQGVGVIIRTAGLERSKKDIERDLAYLARLWEVVLRRVRTQKSPSVVYQESDMIIRTIRDVLTSEIDTIWIDEKNAYERAREFLQLIMPKQVERLKYFDKPEPLFYHFGIEQEIGRIQEHTVPLPQGGSIVIDQTEALVAIDVNSGNFRAEGDAEETAYQINLAAAREIARQLRLRDLGGVIVNDFIDMREERHRRAVEQALRDAVKRDRARTKVLRMSSFGIIEMTRQRIRPSLKRSLYRPCAACNGMGHIKTVESLSIETMRLLNLVARRENVKRVELVVVTDVAEILLNHKRRELADLEQQGDVTIHVVANPAAPPQQIELTCYDASGERVDVDLVGVNLPTRR
jgi:ribonuclease E